MCPDCGERPVFKRWETWIGVDEETGEEVRDTVFVDAPRCRPCHGARLSAQLTASLAPRQPEGETAGSPEPSP